jgi:RNA polymerase sigma-70 factor (ECF subfamily)
MKWVTSTKLLDDLKASKEDAWKDFYDCFKPMLNSFAIKLGLPKNLSEDAAQKILQTFLEVFRKGKYRKKDGRLHNWLFGIAYKIILNMKKKLPREQLIADNQTGTCFWDTIEDNKAVKHTWNIGWHRLILRDCIEKARKKFSAKTFKVFELYTINDLTAEQVATKMAISKNAVFIANGRVLKWMRRFKSKWEKNFLKEHL